MDEYVDSRCNDCNTELVQLGGDWFCPQCDDSEEFTLDGKDYDFTL